MMLVVSKSCFFERVVLLQVQSPQALAGEVEYPSSGSLPTTAIVKDS